MAEKKTPLGADPLAWLTEGDEFNNIDSEPAPKPTARRRRAKPEQGTLGDKTEIELLEKTFAVLLPKGDVVAERFYERLFSEYPQLTPFFDGISIKGQQKKLLASLVLLVQNLHKPEVLNDYLRGLGARHQHYGVVSEQYPLFAENLLSVLEEFCGDVWTTEVEQAWGNTLNTVASIMLEAYESVGDNTTAKAQTEHDEFANTSSDSEEQLTAINKVMGVISFNMDGTIIDVNANFLTMLAYSKEELIGRHHKIFAEPSLLANSEYAEFWEKLNLGRYDSGEYKLIGKGSKEVWLHASYTPIIDANGKPYKVVMYASDITVNKELQNDFTKVMNEASHVMANVSAGDLKQKLEGDYQGEFAVLQTTLNGTINNIAQIMTDINKSVTNVSNAASEISEGHINLSHCTEQQLASVEQTAASMNELTTKVSQNSGNAIQANKLAVLSQQQAEKGGLVIKAAIEAMGAISIASKKVTDIITVIDEIAFQTNLLALNAAVEAARAGDQGRGFAVIASEVRNLARRSASAAKEMKTLMNESGEKVKEGEMLVGESGQTLEEIVKGAMQVAAIVSEIAVASTEQAQGIEQVNQAVSHMGLMSQKNANLVEQATVASEALNQQANNMQRVVGFFQASTDIK